MLWALQLDMVLYPELLGKPVQSKLYHLDLAQLKIVQIIKNLDIKKNEYIVFS